MRLLDFSRPYSEVYGLPGAVYEQDGFNFKSDGTEFKEQHEEEENIIITEDVVPSVTCVEVHSEPVIESSDRNLEDMHWRHLKALVESFGGEWTNKQQALDFMKGKN